MELGPGSVFARKPGIPGRLKQRLCDALVGAFPSDRALAALVMFELDENLERVASARGNLADRAFELLEWAVARGRADDLVRGACRQNPEHPGLRELLEVWPFTASGGRRDPTSLAPGEVVGGRYAVKGLVGRGAMGAVYEVTDVNGRKRALKVLHGRAMQDTVAFQGFAAEARVGANFDDRARGFVADVLDVGFDRDLGANGSPWLVMELLQGETLADRVARTGALPLEKALDLLEDLAAVLDFGIARGLRERTIASAFRLTGTPLFAAPEQWRQDMKVTPATDLWAFGLITFYALTGGYFWRSQRLPGLVEEVHLRAYPTATGRARDLGVSLPEGFDAWFARCVNAAPERRFAVAGDAYASLQRDVGWPEDRRMPLGRPRDPGTAPAPLPSLPPEVRALPVAEDLGEGLDERLRRVGPLSLPAVVAMLREAAVWLAKQRELSDSRAPLEPTRIRFVRGPDGREEVRVLRLDALAVSDLQQRRGGTRTLTMGASALAYVPPELRGVDQCDDLWSVARIAFYALTGVPYVAEGDVIAVLKGIATPSSPSERARSEGREETLPAEFDAWFLRCEPTAGDARFADVGAAVEGIAGLALSTHAEASEPRGAESLPELTPFVGETWTLPPTDSIVEGGVRARRRAWMLRGAFIAALAFAGLVGTVALGGRSSTKVNDAGAPADVGAPIPLPPCPEGMALIPAGEFLMGSAAGEGNPDEHPQHRVRLPAYCMDRTEVSVAAYRACMPPNGDCTAPNAFADTRGSANNFCNWGRTGADEHPVNCVDWTQAKHFCEWSGHDGGARRLPREAEWEYAARGSANRRYPWGNDAPDGTRTNLCGDECVRYGREHGYQGWSQLANWHDAFGATAPVPAFPTGATPDGVLNLGGNVWEWVDDVYASDAYAHHDETGLYAREVTDASQATEYRVSRGGGWGNSDASRVRAAARNRHEPTTRYIEVGFRCARGAR